MTDRIADREKEAEWISADLTEQAESTMVQFSSKSENKRMEACRGKNKSKSLR
jgi:hypothetical protein